MVRHFCALGILTRMRSSLHTTLALLSHCQAHYQLGDTTPGNDPNSGPGSALLHPRDTDALSSVPSESVSQRGGGAGGGRHTHIHTHTEHHHDLSGDTSFAFTSGHFCDEVTGDAREYTLLVDLRCTLQVAALCASLVVLQVSFASV